MDLHYSQTMQLACILCIPFYYLMDLHYSQTTWCMAGEDVQFYYLMDLHYSQTRGIRPTWIWQFYYLMDLHYSQTWRFQTRALTSFTTLWIYTILKRSRQTPMQSRVLLPYGFTLFSN